MESEIEESKVRQSQQSGKETLGTHALLGPDIKIEVAIPEQCLHSLMQIDSSPSIAIRKLVIGHRHAFAHQRIGALDPWQMDLVRVPIAHYSTDHKSEQSYPVWDQNSFGKLILTLMESMETREDTDELFSFLIAYGSNESNKPTAIQLKHRMSKQIAESNPEIWNQYLRKCKARLTITAKNLDLPKLFSKPYGKSPNRKHPIDRDLHHFLIPWISGGNERFLISLDGQSHEDSIEILREFTPPEFVIG